MQSKSKSTCLTSALALLVVSAFVLGGVLVSTQPAQAGTTGGVCMVERFNATKPANVTDLNCTSNDVQLAQYTVVSGPSECLEGQDVTLTLQGKFLATSDERWDVGVFVHENGGTPNSLPSSGDDTCYLDYLNPVSANNTDLDLDGGSGPFYNGEITEDPGDLCGDIEQGVPTFFNTDQITIVCQDSDNNGTADVGTCTVWANSRSSGISGDPSCIDENTSNPTDPTPGGGTPMGVTAQTTAKCTCDNVEIAGLTVLKSAKLEVVKKVLPDGFVYTNDSFDLQIDDVPEADDVGDGGSTGIKTVDAGTSANPGADHIVGESAGTDTDLANYTSSIECVDRGTTNVRASSSDSGPLTVSVQPDDNIVCTITNSLNLAKVTILKTVSGGVIPNGESFRFRVHADPTTGDDSVGDVVADATITGDGDGPNDSTDFGGTEFLPGTYALCESVRVGWKSSLSEDSSSFSNQDGNPDASNEYVCVNFTLDPDQTKEFLVDNTPPPGGDAKTIGFWRNWSCDGIGNQDDLVTPNLPQTLGVYVIDQDLNGCKEAVDLLSKHDIDDPTLIRDGDIRANDGAYQLAAQLMAAKLSIAAGAGTCAAVNTAITAADALLASLSGPGPDGLGGVGFDGGTDELADQLAGIDSYLPARRNQSELAPLPSAQAYSALRNQAIELASTLNDYNNNNLCP